jgi:hypothetical protein
VAPEKLSSASPTVQPVCPPGGCNGGGHGTGGGGTTPGGPLSFLGATNLNVPVGGVSGRQGPGVSNGTVSGQIAYVYANPNDPFGDQYGDDYIWYGTSQQQPARINLSAGCCVVTTANPALQEVLIGGAAHLFLAGVSQQGAVDNYSGVSNLFRLDGSTWTSLGQISTQSTIYSPSLAASPQYLFTGLLNTDNTLTICRTDITILNGATSCTQHPGSTKMTFNPGMAYWNGVLYMAFEDTLSAHNLRLFTSTDNGQTITENTNIAANPDQTSAVPSLIVLNNALYVGFRSNDSSQHLLYKYSTDGINFTASTDTGLAMTSGPSFVFASTYLYNYFTTTGSTPYLSSDPAPNP